MSGKKLFMDDFRDHLILFSISDPDCAVLAKTDNAASIANILSAIHLKRDMVIFPKS